MEKLRVNKLQKGDTIGFLIASSANRSDRFQKIEEEINKLGFKVKFGKTCYLKDGYLAGTDEERISDIHEMFADPEIKAIICYKGGAGASRIIDKLEKIGEDGVRRELQSISINDEAIDKIIKFLPLYVIEYCVLNKEAQEAIMNLSNNELCILSQIIKYAEKERLAGAD